MEWVSNNLVESLLILGIVLLVIEILVLGFSTFVIFFVGVAAIITSALLYAGIVPDSVLSAFFSTAVITVIAAALLWKPLKNLQSNVDTSKAKGDLVGHRFVLTDDVSPKLTPQYRYSGVDWSLISKEPLEAGTEVEVAEAQVGKFFIKAVSTKT
ncbi:NfeD family protein [Glaciecola petra]|uniref:NfeD family protein n=1 Tax=Glaciecola petra TaxID=3075602 RepID=A0ABU2ZMR9_9ALTE|nr:NfeD family protein [Aestuariibacter sp. P117]MDT0593546.1 NfeD family protein [Aestuariibacter sp. P117]